MRAGDASMPDVVVHIVEDHDSSRRATARLLEAAGYVVKVYPSAIAFLAEPPPGAGCLVLDLHLPGPSGLDLQDVLAATANPLPIVFLSGRSDVPSTARAMKGGAIDFLTKPVMPAALLAAVADALLTDARNRSLREHQRAARARYERLTPREREVFAHVISGQLNKQAASDLGTSEHTIKVHRQRIMQKLEADSLAALVRIGAALGVVPIGQVR